MAINVSHQPVTAVPAAAAYLGGLGQYQKYLDEMRLKQAQMAQQDAQQQRSIAASMAQQQNAQQFGLMNNMLDAAQRQQAMRMQAEMQQRFQGQQFGQQQAMAQLQAQLQAQNQAAHAAAMQKGYEAHDERLNRYKTDAEQRRIAFESARAQAMQPTQTYMDWQKQVQEAKAEDGVTPLQFSKIQQEQIASLEKAFQEATKNPEYNAEAIAKIRENHDKALAAIKPTEKPWTIKDNTQVIEDPATGQKAGYIILPDGKPPMKIQADGKNAEWSLWESAKNSTEKLVASERATEEDRKFLQHLRANPPAGSGIKPFGNGETYVDPKDVTETIPTPPSSDASVSRQQQGYREDTGGEDVYSQNARGQFVPAPSEIENRVKAEQQYKLALAETAAGIERDDPFISKQDAFKEAVRITPKPQQPIVDKFMGQGFTPATPEERKKVPGVIGSKRGLPVVNDISALNHLPPGTQFLTPSGSLRVVPQRTK